jgi:hypothetical protein
LLDKNLNAFANDNFREADKARLSKSEIESVMLYRDTSVVTMYDALGNEKAETVIENRFLLGKDIKSYLLKEDWFFNSFTGQLEKRIIAIAPLIYNRKEEKTVPLFWLYFSEWKELLDLFEAKNYKDDKRISYAYALQNQYYFSIISKESNVFGRAVKDSQHGSDTSVESDVINGKINNSAGDLFQN